MKTEKILIGEIAMNEDRTEGGKGDIESLARNMAKYGQINAVTVVEDISNSYRYRIVAGRRRITAAQSLGWTEIRADVYKADELGKESEEMIALSENAAREEMNAIDEGVLYANELRRGMPVEELAALFCRNKSTVYQRAKLASLIPEMRGLYKAGKMSLHVAAMAAVLPEEAQKGFADKVGSGWVSEWDIKRAVSNASNDTLSQLEGCADCVNCAKRTHYSDKTLFPELADESDKCLDHDCYCKKLCAVVEKAFDAWGETARGTPEFDMWDGKRIISTASIPDGLHIVGVKVGKINRENGEREIPTDDTDLIDRLVAAGKSVEYVPCWTGNEFLFAVIANENDVDEVTEEDLENEPSWVKERREKWNAIFASLPEAPRAEIISDATNAAKIEDKANEIYRKHITERIAGDNTRSANPAHDKAVAVVIGSLTRREIMEVLPSANITDNDTQGEVFDKLSEFGDGILLGAILASYTTTWRFRPPLCNFENYKEFEIFNRLGIDLATIRDEAVSEALSQTESGTPPKTAEPETYEPPAEENGSETEDDDGLGEQPFDYGDDDDDSDIPDEDESEYEHDRMFYEED